MRKLGVGYRDWLSRCSLGTWPQAGASACSLGAREARLQFSSRATGSARPPAVTDGLNQLESAQ